ncbi:unnamed protein product [Arabidopsis thaliana]|uniref:RING-type domain-containing protein n=1 Tax=Arabidopsis thaliana TaxID=3702 RepID=A0A654GB79_ARATH|nr:unnamed protein product [Arabidopsis thaliana]
MKNSYKHELISTSTNETDRVINRCFLRKKTTKEVIHLKASQVESDSYSFIVTYQPNLRIRHENLDGHQLKTTLERHPDRVFKLEDNIPKQFLVSQETCLEHVMIILSAMYLPQSIQERLVRYISTESVKFRNRRCGRGGGLKVEVDVKVDVEQWVRIDCCCKQKGTCLVPALDCPICLTELSSGVSRMKLPCSHVFHRDCIMTWLKKNPSCPICRTKALGKTVSIY